MGLVLREVEFTGHTPTAEAIIAKMTEISGLEIYKNSLSEVDDIYDLHLDVHFACLPNETVRLTVYNKQKVAQQKQQASLDLKDAFSNIDTERLTTAEKTLLDSNLLQYTRGFDEPPDKQLVYLRCGMGNEPTVMHTIETALVALGGKSMCPRLDVDITFPLDNHELINRAKKNRSEVTRFILGSIVINLILLPISAIKHAAFFPFQKRKLVRELKENYPNLIDKD